MSVGKFVRKQVEAGVGDPDLIAEAYLAAALRAPVAERRELLLRPVRQAVGAEFSSVSKAMRLSSRADDESPAGQGRRRTNRQAHNDGWVWDPGTGDFIPLGLATVAQFRAAIAYYRARIDSHEKTIAEYERYVKEIESAGVTCLDEIS